MLEQCHILKWILSTDGKRLIIIKMLIIYYKIEINHANYRIVFIHLVWNCRHILFPIMTRSWRNTITRPPLPWIFSNYYLVRIFQTKNNTFKCYSNATCNRYCEYLVPPFIKNANNMISRRNNNNGNRLVSRCIPF